MLSIKFSARAKYDFVEITKYTHQQWGEAQRYKYMGAIDRSLQVLAEKPAIGRSCEHIRKSVFCYSVGEHVIYYRVRENQLFVLRILHSRQNVERAFR